MFLKILNLKGVRTLSKQESKTINGGVEVNDCSINCVDAYFACVASGNTNCVAKRNSCFRGCGGGGR